MRRGSYLLGTLLVISMLLAACGGEQTSTSIPNTDVPPVTVEATATMEATETTEAGDVTTTPVVPVTGENDLSRVSNLLDLDVWNQNGEQVGEVEDMVLDADNLNISYVVIETGGFLDLGDKTVLIPWNSLELQTPATGGQENAFVLTADQAMLANATDVDLEAVLPDMGESATDWDAEIRNFWEGGVMPEATQPGDATATTPEGTVEATVAPEITATTESDSGTGAGQGNRQLQGVMLASELLGSTITISNQSNAGTGTVDATAMPEATATTEAGSGTGTGTEAQRPTDATIEDVIVDPSTGDVLFLVLNALFDDGDRWIPIPLSTLRWDTTNQVFLFVANANALQNAPFFQADQWPDTTADGWDSEFDTFWQNNSTGDGSGSGTVTIETATPTP